MDRLEHKIYRKITRRRRIRAKIYGTTARPRLTVFISNRQISAQIINDEKQSTIAAVTTVANKSLPANLTQKAAWVGGEIAKKAKSAKIKRVVLDRNGRLYHGRIKVLADEARKSGLEL